MILSYNIKKTAWVLTDEDCTKLYDYEDEKKFRELFTEKSRIDLRNKIGKYETNGLVTTDINKYYM